VKEREKIEEKDSQKRDANRNKVHEERGGIKMWER